MSAVIEASLNEDRVFEELRRLVREFFELNSDGPIDLSGLAAEVAGKAHLLCLTGDMRAEAERNAQMALTCAIGGVALAIVARAKLAAIPQAEASLSTGATRH